MADEAKQDSATKPAHKSKKLAASGTVITAALATATLAFDRAEYGLVGTCLWVAGVVAVGYALAQGIVEAAAALRKAP